MGEKVRNRPSHVLRLGSYSLPRMLVMLGLLLAPLFVDGALGFYVMVAIIGFLGAAFSVDENRFGVAIDTAFDKLFAFKKGTDE